jgi:hypothetical protein
MLGMTLGCTGNWRARLLVATDCRLPLSSKPTLPLAGCTEIPYDEVQVSDGVPTGRGCELRLVASGKRQPWHLMFAERGERCARLLAEQSEPVPPRSSSRLIAAGGQ